MMENKEKNGSLPSVTIIDKNPKKQIDNKTEDPPHYGKINGDFKDEMTKVSEKEKSWRKWCRIEPLIVLFYVATSAIGTIYPQLLYEMIADDLGYDGSDENGTGTGECVDDDSASYTSGIFLDRAANFWSRRIAFTTRRLQATSEVTESDVQSEVNTWNILVLASAMLPGIFMIPSMGAWSDKVGRKKALIPALASCTIRTIIYLFIAIFDLPVWTWIISSLAEGVTGGTFTVLSAAFSYVIDVTTLKNRSRSILIIELCTGLGSIISYIATGLLIDSWGFTIPIAVCVAIYILCLLYAIFLLPESKTTTEQSKLFTLQHIKKAFHIFSPKITPRRTRLGIYGGLTLLFFVYFFAMGGEGILSFYMLNYPICWEPLTISLYKSSDYIIQATGSILLMRFLYPKTGELGLIIVSCLSGAAMNLFLGFSTTTLMIFVSSTFGFAVRTGQPMSRALISKYVPAEHQGSIMALTSLCTTIPLLLGNMVFNTIYSATLDWYRGFGFIFVAGCFAIPLVVAILFLFGRRRGIINRSHEDEKIDLKDGEIITKF